MLTVRGVIMCLTVLEKSFFPVLYSGKYNPILTDVLIQQLAVTLTCKNYQLLKLHLVWLKTCVFLYTASLGLCSLNQTLAQHFFWLTYFATNCNLFLNILKMCPSQQPLCCGSKKRRAWSTVWNIIHRRTSSPAFSVMRARGSLVVHSKGKLVKAS